MRSRAEWRVALERAAFGLAVALIAWALWRSTRPRVATWASRAASLREAVDGAGVAMRLTDVPSDTERARLRGLRGAGVPVRWTRTGAVAASIIELRRLRDPIATVRVTALGGAGAVLRDSLGPIDSLPDGGTLDLAAPSGRARLLDAGVSATVRTPTPTGQPDTVLVLGRAEWETKFLVAALEERGWAVALRTPISPTGAVTQARVRLDPATTAAVVLADSTATLSSDALAAYVRAGGGVVLVGSGNAHRAARALAPGVVGTRTPESTAPLDATKPLDGLARRAITALRSDAVVLARSGGVATIAARREGRGRVLQIGYEGLWRWRMEFGALEAHRAWWSAQVTRVADEGDATAASDDDPAPTAALLDALGPPTRDALPASERDSAPWRFGATLLLMLALWGSRRLRGAP
ncbi:MAG: hypothetical protein K2X99_06365 [Gemmatimonadaceae bacterium]|nr:hypothetical protein [Gemmatimonadaceae bacterium]